MDSGTSASAIARKLIDVGANYIFLESEIPYPIRRTTQLQQARNYYPQLEDMRNRNSYPWSYQHVEITGVEEINETYYDDILKSNVTNNALISENLVKQAKKALVCGGKINGLISPPGPLPAALATFGRNYLWSEDIYNYAYVNEVYFPGNTIDHAGHAIVIIGWATKDATDVQVEGMTLNWDQIWGNTPISPGPPPVFLHNRVMRTWATNFLNSGYTTWAQVENDVKGVFIFIDNHNDEVYFAPYFEKASLECIFRRIVDTDSGASWTAKRSIVDSKTEHRGQQNGPSWTALVI